MLAGSTRVVRAKGTEGQNKDKPLPASAAEIVSISAVSTAPEVS